MMPRVSVCMTDRDGNVTEFTIDRATMTVDQALLDSPRVDMGIRALRLWQEWFQAFLKERLTDDAMKRVVEINRETFARLHPEEAAFGQGKKKTGAAS